MGLITAAQVKANTSMGGNVDKDHLDHLIDNAEAMVLEPVLGTKLYDKIVTDFNEGSTNNLAGDYLTMYNDYIKAILWNTVVSDYISMGNVRVQNGGVFTHKSEGDIVAPLDRIQYTAKYYKSAADSYIERLTKFLCVKNITEYDNAQDNNYDIKPKNINTIGGWYLGSEKPITEDNTWD